MVRGARQAGREFQRLCGGNNLDWLIRTGEFDSGKPVFGRVPGAIYLEEKADRLEEVSPREDEGYPTQPLVRRQSSIRQGARGERPVRYLITAQASASCDSAL